MYLRLDESPIDDLVSRQFEHLIRESNVRAIHCHFQGAPSPKDKPVLWQAYVRAIEMEPSQLQTTEDSFKDGRLINIEPRGKDATEFAKWFATATGDRDRVGELVIGNNPYLTPVAVVNPSADLGYRAGTVRLDVGENWESGGELRTGDHQQWAIMVTDGTLTAGRELLIKEGVPVP